jgi:hypothetical protein
VCLGPLADEVTAVIVGNDLAGIDAGDRAPVRIGLSRATAPRRGGRGASRIVIEAVP